MKAILVIRSALYDMSQDVRQNSSDHIYGNHTCNKITIYYAPTFTKQEAIVLSKSIGSIACDKADAFSISEFRNGSTFVEMVASTTVNVSSVLIACGLLIRQATTTVEKIIKLKNKVAELIDIPETRKKPKRKSVSTKLPALQRAGNVSPDIDSVKLVMKNSGETLVRFDDKADIKIEATEEYSEMATEGLS